MSLENNYTENEKAIDYGLIKNVIFNSNGNIYIEGESIYSGLKIWFSASKDENFKLNVHEFHSLTTEDYYDASDYLKDTLEDMCREHSEKLESEHEEDTFYTHSY